MTDTAGVPPGLSPSMIGWIEAVTGAVELSIERRLGGASRAGYAVDARLADGTTRALWLRMDTGHGPQSKTTYTLRREAAVYRALQDSSLKVARLVAVHPQEEAFLMERLEGRNWFAEVTDPVEQVTLATAFMAQIAALHRIDVHTLDLPELGSPRRISDHVRDELDIWDEQYRSVHDPDPLVALALVWLRTNMPPDDDWPLVLVQGDTGPGNFMYSDVEIVAITDWEMAHFGDLHDDLAWIYVRDLQERFTSLPDRLRDYERFRSITVDATRLRYFLVLAQARCAIGTRNGLLARDSRGEIANHLIYSILHLRLLAEALADAEQLPLPARPAPIDDDSDDTWMYDVALADLRDFVVPNVIDRFANRRAKGLARLLKYLREVDRMGPAMAQADLDEIEQLVGHRSTTVAEARQTLAAAIESGAIDARKALTHCLAHIGRRTEMARSAMGALADRHYSPIE